MNIRSARFLFSLLSLVLSAEYALASTYLITCATSGIGESTAERLAKENHSLILAGRDQVKLERISRELKEKFPLIEIAQISLDFDSEAQVRSASKEVLAYLVVKQKSLDGVVLVGPRPNFSSSTPTPEEWHQSFQTTFVGPVQLINDLERGSGFGDQSSIVVISGASSKYFFPGYGNSNVHRAAWPPMVATWKDQFKSRTRVNVISPGFIVTPHNEEVLQSRADKNGITYEDQYSRECANIPLQRLGTPEDVADTVKAFLIDLKYINGQNIVLDGGQSPVY